MRIFYIFSFSGWVAEEPPIPLHMAAGAVNVGLFYLVRGLGPGEGRRLFASLHSEALRIEGLLEILKDSRDRQSALLELYLDPLIHGLQLVRWDDVGVGRRRFCRACSGLLGHSLGVGPSTYF